MAANGAGGFSRRRLVHAAIVRHRTPAEIAAARAVPPETLRDPEADAERVQRDPWLVVIGVCTHAGCTPKGPLGEYGGWYCLGHGSQFDTSGRVRSGPARSNLAVPAVRVRRWGAHPDRRAGPRRRAGLLQLAAYAAAPRVVKR